MIKQTILDITNEEACNYFLQASKYCTIDLPKYFDFQPLLNCLDKKIGRKTLYEIVQDKPDSKKDTKDTPKDYEGVNYKFLTNKDGNFAWRPMQIINPAIYVCLVNRITEEENWAVITSRFKKFQENEKIKCYSLPLLTEESNSQIKKDSAQSIINWWKEIEQQSIELALKYNCVLITDITDCYGSIYTHSIGWALHGKKAAREDNKQKPKLCGCIIDDLIRAMSYRQSNGIPQGSVLMDFIAEMVLGYADMLLSYRLNGFEIDENEQQVGKTEEIVGDYQILRYRDDYRIFAKTQEDAVKIAKVLSEILSELNLRLNTQKTFVSNNIIRDVIKPDKLYWNEAKHGEKTLQNHLLLIHSLAEKHPNTGSVSRALNKFLDRVYPLNILKNDSSKVLISILVDIAYNNPRVYSLVVVCIGKILSIEPDKLAVEDIYKLIEKKFDNKPNVGYWKVWFQRLTIKTDREREKDSDESLCKVAANATVNLWINDWLKQEYQTVFENTSIFNEEAYNNLSENPGKDEAKIFGY